MYFSVQEILQKEMPNINLDPEIYSLEDLVLVRSGEMRNKLKYLVELCCKHTAECQVSITCC